MFYLDTALTNTDGKCYFMPHNRMKNQFHLMNIIEETNAANDTTYILNCDVPQENILKSSDPYLNTLIGTMRIITILNFIKILFIRLTIYEWCI